MASARALTSVVRCIACRRSVLDFFVSGFASLPNGRAVVGRSQRCAKQERAFSRWPVSRPNVAPQKSQEDAAGQDSEPINTEDSLEIHTDQSRDAFLIPWYLQVQEQRHLQRPD